MVNKRIVSLAKLSIESIDSNDSEFMKKLLQNGKTEVMALRRKNRSLHMQCYRKSKSAAFSRKLLISKQKDKQKIFEILKVRNIRFIIFLKLLHSLKQL